MHPGFRPPTLQDESGQTADMESTDHIAAAELWQHWKLSRQSLTESLTLDPPAGCGRKDPQRWKLKPLEAVRSEPCSL